MMTYPPRVRLLAFSSWLLMVSGSCFLLFLLACLRLQGQTCNDLSVVSLDADCSVLITPDMVLEGSYTDSLFVVNLTTQTGIPVGSVLTASNLGDTLRATVTDTTSGNSCWGFLVAEDKWAPSIACSPLTLPCALPFFTPDYLANTLGLNGAYPVASDNCSAVDLTFVDTWLPLGCDDPDDRSARIERVWTATDAAGNQSVCTQFLDIRRVHIGNIGLPADTILSCTAPLTAPKFTGQPFYTAFGVKFPLFPDQPLCDVQISYTDQVLPLCTGSYNILRTWVIYDDCLGAVPPPLSNPFFHVQVIQVSDKTGPVFTCPNDTVVFTDPFACSRSFDLTDVLLTDYCSRLQAISASWQADGQSYALPGTLSDFPGNNWWNPDTLGVLGLAANLPADIIVFRYTATDDCGNTATCSFQVTVTDGIPPLVACDEYTQVALGGTGMALVHASTFDDGSYDFCSPVRFKARRVEPNGCQPNDHFYDAVKFCCADVGDTIAIILRVYDLPVDTGAVSLDLLENHATDCLVQVFVEDKIKPVCSPPPHQTLSCKNFDPTLLSHGQAAFADNCCLDTTLELPPNYSQFDTLCNRGTIIRTFRAVDCNGLSSQCTQRLIVNYQQDYAVKMPDDMVVYNCDTTGVYGPEPEIFGKDCEYIAISHHDEASTGGIQSCFRILRKWMIIDWCSYNPNLPLVEVPNPNPGSDPLDPQNLPGPIIAPTGYQPAPTKMRITSNDPEPTDFSIFWAASANGYLYQQIITVQDNVPPMIRGCPVVDDAVEFCDDTNNDPQLWNAPYWNDPHITDSHDLCETATDLAVTANDGCSKGNVNIRYLLYLDLDGDGHEETVINSINPPPYNTVLFGNAMTPNFNGGEARAFDQRPVPPDEKYGFTIQLAGYVFKTAYVRWATEKEPEKYVIPKLPHGRHRILWIIEDGCGNETYCEYPIEVKDCHQPDLVCINGLSANIPVDQSITLWVADFLLYTDDNCTPADQLKLGIRKSGTGFGFPYNPDGTPQKNVTFDCSELGTQQVELWSQDAAGNYNVCTTYVIVQDNFGACSNNNNATIAGVIRTEAGQGLEDAGVQLDGAAPGLPPLSIFHQTTTIGAYEFPNALPFGSDLQLAPAKNNDPLNGVSTFDLVLINKHILGLEPLSSPYKMIAADANNSRSITTFDIIELRKLILGINTSFPDNNSWRFIDKSYSFPNPANPFQDDFPETRQVLNIQSNSLGQDFVAVKVGDVNGNAVTNSLLVPDDRSAGTLIFDVSLPDRTGDWTVQTGDVFIVDFQAAETVAGYQFTLLFPGLQLLDLVPGPNMTQQNFGVFPNDHALTTSFDHPEERGSFQVTFRADAPGRLNEMLAISGRITKAEAYRNAANGGKGRYERMDVAWRFAAPEGPVISEHGFELYQNQPNPWTETTRIGFYLPQAGDARFAIFDQTGNLLFEQRQWYEKGSHSLALNKTILDNAAGMLYYRLETATDNAVQKMIREQSR